MGDTDDNSRIDLVRIRQDEDGIRELIARVLSDTGTIAMYQASKMPQDLTEDERAHALLAIRNNQNQVKLLVDAIAVCQRRGDYNMQSIASANAERRLTIKKITGVITIIATAAMGSAAYLRDHFKAP